MTPVCWQNLSFAVTIFILKITIVDLDLPTEEKNTNEIAK
jgi:hypothetical protein